MAEYLFYPAAAVNFTIRLDEAIAQGSMPKPKTAKASASALVERVTAEIAASVQSLKLSSSLLTAVDGKLSRRYAIVPRQGSAELPGYRQAGKFSLTLSFRDFPVDPRAVRALGVEFFLGTVPAQDFQSSQFNLASYGSKIATAVTKNTNNLVLAGVADVIGMRHSEKGSEVKIEGRSYQGMFLDARIHATTLKRLNLNANIEAIVTQLVELEPLAQGKIPVKADDASLWPNGEIPKLSSKDAVTRVNFEALEKSEAGKENTGKANRGTKGDSSGLVFWDLITNFCYLCGAIPYFEGHVLRIRPVEGLFTKLRQIDKTPFKGGKQREISTKRGTDLLTVRRMVYGKNLSTVSLERRLGGISKPHAIRVVSNLTDSTKKGPERILEYVYPPGEDVITDVAPSGQTSKKEIATIPVSGIRDLDRLKVIARAIFEEIGRGEIGGSASSKDLTSFGGDNEDADILRLRPGDPVEFLTEASGLATFPPIVSEMNDLVSRSEADTISDVAARMGGDTELARVLVGTVRGTLPGLTNIYRVETVKYDWDVERGIAVDFDFKNFVEVRFAQ